MEEIWKDIKGYEGLYQVSNLGRVKSLYKEIIKSNGRNFYSKEKLLKFTMRSGYYNINLTSNKIRKSFEVHRLVAQAFIPNVNNLPQVNHKNGNKTDNKVENLEWVTRKGNMEHATKILKVNFRPKIKIVQYDRKGNYIKKWESLSNASKELGISCSSISKCCKRKLKTAGKYVWRYKDI